MTTLSYKAPPVIHCPNCGRAASLQLILTPEQVAHMLGARTGHIKALLTQGRMGYRYRRGPGSKLRRVIDYFQVWDFVLAELPRREDLDSPGAEKNKEAIKRIIAWAKMGGRKREPAQ